MEEFLQQLSLAFKVPSERVIFRACTFAAVDPLVDAKEITRMPVTDMWRISGYRFW